MKKINLLLMMVIFASLIYAAYSQVTTLSTGASSVNITFYPGENETRYINVPNYAYITNFTFTLFSYGIPSENITIRNLEEQWSSQGTFSLAAANAVDEDYGNFPASVNNNWGTIYENTTAPIEYDLAYWDYEYDFQGAGETEHVNVSCYNGTDWLLFNSNLGTVNSTSKRLNATIPSICYLTPLQIKTDITDVNILSTYYYEGQAWFINTSSFVNGSYMQVGEPDATNEWNFNNYNNTERVNETVNIDIDILNNILEDGCTCTDCVNTTQACQVPIEIFSDNAGILEISDISLNYTYGVDNCTNSYGVDSNGTAFYFSFIDTSRNPINVNLSTYLSYGSSNFSTGTSLLNNFQYCIYPSWLNLTGDISFQYQYNDILYTYEQEGAIFNNDTTYINLTIEATGTTDVTATVYDDAGNELEGAYVYPQRYDAATGNYISIGQFATNFEGQTKIPLTLNTVKYKFLLYYPSGTLLETTNPTYIYANTISFYLQTEETSLSDYFTSEGILSNLTYDNSTFTFTHLYLDPDSEVTYACLYIYLMKLTSPTVYGQTCQTGASGTLNFAVTNTSGSTYLAKSSVFIGGNEIPMNSLSVYFPAQDASDAIGFMGLLVDLLLTISFAFMLFFSIPLAVIMIPLPTVMLSMIHFIQVDPAIAWGIEIGAVVLAIIINRR